MSKRHAVRVPPITRVHNLYRFRFTTNEVARFIKEGKPPTSISFEKVLTSFRLSKKSTVKLRDRQGRRSRDHLLTSVILTLLNRSLKRNEFHYAPSPLGKLLSVYDFKDQCPKDTNESVVFTTALLRMKFINGHYEDETFRRLRYRPIVTILYALSRCHLHLLQLYYLLGKTQHDVAIDAEAFNNLLEGVVSPKYHERDGIETFAKTHRLTDADRDESGRSVRPLLSWCLQTGLVWSDDETVYHITQKGQTLLKHALQIRPLWYRDLGYDPKRKAVLLLLSQASHYSGVEIPQSFLKENINLDSHELFATSNSALLKDLYKRMKVLKHGLMLIKPIDFDPFYDIPYEDQPEVHQAYKEIALTLKIKLSLEELSLIRFKEIRTILYETPEERELRRLATFYQFEPPRKELFRVNFEYESCFVLKRLGLNADKYQGQLADVVQKHLKNFAENNPDILVTNDISYLIECKSKDEWPIRTSYNKRVRGEITNYQDLAREVEANSAIILVEEDFENDEFFEALEHELGDLSKVILMSYSFLKSLVQDKKLFKAFRKIANEPEKYSPVHRILSVRLVNQSKLN